MMFREESFGMKIYFKKKLYEVVVEKHKILLKKLSAFNLQYARTMQSIGTFQCTHVWKHFYAKVE
jgi:hypothetical protein